MIGFIMAAAENNDYEMKMSLQNLELTKKLHPENSNYLNNIIDENKKENKFELTKLDDIYNYSEQIIKATERLIK